MLFKNRKSKIFCIGQNKTGTTSIQDFFLDHGFKVGNQRTAELLTNDYIERNWKPILDYCKTAEVFQDIPFSNEYLYVLLDYHFPNAKFILTIRSSSVEWYNSISKFHTKLFGKDGRIPMKEDLKNAEYISKGFIWTSFYEKYGEFKNDIYNQKHLIDLYERRNENIKHYFKDKDNLLVIDIASEGAVNKLSQFIGVTPNYKDFPWKNRTSDI